MPEWRNSGHPVGSPVSEALVCGQGPHSVLRGRVRTVLVDAEPCSDTKKPFRTENGPATLQPRGEFYERRAGPAGASSPEGNG